MHSGASVMVKVKEEGFDAVARKNDQELVEFRNKNQEMVDKPRIGFGRGLVNYMKSNLVVGVLGIATTLGVMFAKGKEGFETLSESMMQNGGMNKKFGLFVGLPVVASVVAGTLYFNKKDRKHNKENAEANVATVDAVVQQKITQEEAAALRQAQASGQAVGQHSAKAVNAKEHAQSSEIAV
jgi:hypothetical protein